MWKPERKMKMGVKINREKEQGEKRHNSQWALLVWRQLWVKKNLSRVAPKLCAGHWR